jgi:hypothetical protein
MAKLTFKAIEVSALPQEIVDDLAVIDAAKARINSALAAAAGEGWKAQHSYKLDFAAGKRVFKVAFYRAAQPKVHAAGAMFGTLAEFISAQTQDGRAT